MEPLLEHALDLDGGVRVRVLELEGEGAPLLSCTWRLDRMVPHSGARRVMEVLGGRGSIELVLLEDRGHCPQIEWPGRVTELLQDFARTWVPSRHHEASPSPARRPPRRRARRAGPDPA